jgi:thymidylate synthase (FAD)
MSELKIVVLDHGFVQLRNIAGPTRRTQDPVPDNMDSGFEGGWTLQPRPFDADDTDPADAARMSFDQMSADRARETDLKLCDYLMKNKHTSPFEMIEVWLEMKIPIFVARQFVRHRTVSINEVSGRYITLPGEWYVPATVGGKPPKAKQGQVDTLPISVQDDFRYELDDDCRSSYGKYLKWLERGVAPEHARLTLHLNHYTHWLWKQDLHNLMHFLSLRDHSHAQVEAQHYARAIDTLIRTYLPETMELYDKYRRMTENKTDDMKGIISRFIQFMEDQSDGDFCPGCQTPNYLHRHDDDCEYNALMIKARGLISG